MKDQETRQRFVELRAQGFSYDKISKELKVSKQTLINWSNELELDIANLKAIELEALQEQYYLTKAERIKLFGERLKAIKQELDKRSMEELSIKELFDMQLKCYSALDNEIKEVEFQKDSTFTGFDFNNFATVKKWKG